ncbi:hypothetical protein V6N12_003554 [Hibiscus sabdariffa]|uniref:Cucumisin n=1 Tax=Hibiscus sabdariffa TaxID=183260 RepID=A0ABR2B3Y6_9ROSI
MCQINTDIKPRTLQSYIVYLGNLPKGGSSTALLHNSMLQDVFGSDPVAKSVLYSYKRSFNGFVVELTEDEARKIAGNEPKDVAFSYPLPASHLDMVDGSKILIYINSTRNATATIFKSDEGYGTRLLQQVTGDNTRCPEATNGTVPDLNYPSFSVFTSSSTTVNHVFNRTVTNVGSPTAIYRANASFPTGALKIRVSPNVLSFSSVGEKLSFEVIVEGKMDESMVSGSLVWDDGEHQVRSPVVVFVSIST